MNRRLIAVALALVAGLAAGAIVYVARAPQPEEPVRADAAHYFDPSAGTGERIRALEVAVAEERNARQLLEEEIQILYSEIEALSASQAPEAEREPRREEVAEARQRIERIRGSRGENATERRIELLVEAGFSAGRAEWILKRESELQMESMRARFEARASGQGFDPSSLTANPQAALREEIGDQQYEQYLQANGRATAVSVASVLESSPAQQAGLSPGDQIVSYNGRRIFDAGELNRLTMSGELGESVVVDIVRDGVPMQVVLPSGPIGIYTGSSRRGR